MTARVEQSSGALSPGAAAQWRSARALACLWTPLLLGACAGSSGGLTGQLFGNAAPAQPGFAQGTTAAAQPQAVAAVTPDYFLVHGKCPDVEVDPDEQALTVYQNGAAENPNNVRYQATIDDTARECNTLQAGLLTLRVGIAGRVVSGPRPVSGTVNVPIRLAVIDDTDTVIKTTWTTLAVGLTAPDYSADYSKVAEISVPAPEQSVTLRIQAALDPNQPKPAPTQRAPAPPRVASPAPPRRTNNPPVANSRAPAVFNWPG
ncbi:MAG: hypothetical protein U1E56_06065 [Bauldia sp.]